MTNLNSCDELEDLRAVSKRFRDDKKLEKDRKRS